MSRKSWTKIGSIRVLVSYQSKAGRKADNEYRALQSGCAGLGAASLSEYFNDGKVGIRVESLFDISDCEEECDKDTKCERAVDNNCKEDDPWDGRGSVFDLLRPVKIGELDLTAAKEAKRDYMCIAPSNPDSVNERCPCQRLRYA